MTGWLATAVVALLLLAAGVAAAVLAGRWRQVPRRASDPLLPTGAAAVAVVIPARDEAASLPALLDSLRALAVAPAQVLVVDDGSRDATGLVSREAGADVLHLDGPPAGWTGKAWACHRGAEATRAPLLLFLDADTRLAPQALGDLLALHQEHGGLISVQPYHEVRRPYEQLSAYFNLVSLLAASWQSTDPEGRGPTRRPLAFGPCLLTSRADYELAGGHAAVRGEVLDDIRLAGAYRRAGLSVRSLLGGHSVRMRMYPGGLRQLAQGWTKNIASGAQAAAPGSTAVVVAWIAAQHAIAVGAALSLVQVLLGRAGSLEVAGPALWVTAWVAASWQLRRLLRRVGSFRWWTWAVFALPLLGFDILFARSVLATAVGHSVRWRGRDVAVGRTWGAASTADRPGARNRTGGA